jgi:hypothetical protein
MLNPWTTLLTDADRTRLSRIHGVLLFRSARPDRLGAGSKSSRTPNCGKWCAMPNSADALPTRWCKSPSPAESNAGSTCTSKSRANATPILRNACSPTTIVSLIATPARSPVWPCWRTTTDHPSVPQPRAGKWICWCFPGRSISRRSCGCLGPAAPAARRAQDQPCDQSESDQAASPNGHRKRRATVTQVKAELLQQELSGLPLVAGCSRVAMNGCGNRENNLSRPDGSVRSFGTVAGRWHSLCGPVLTGRDRQSHSTGSCLQEQSAGDSRKQAPRRHGRCERNNGRPSC